MTRIDDSLVPFSRLRTSWAAVKGRIKTDEAQYKFYLQKNYKQMITNTCDDVASIFTLFK